MSNMQGYPVRLIEKILSEVKMRIGVVDVSASSGGALSVINDLYNYIQKHEIENEWYFIVSTPTFPDCNNIKVIRYPWIKKNWLYRAIWELFFSRKAIERYKFDIVLSLQSVCVNAPRTPQVVFIHTALPFQKERSFSFLKKDERLLAFYQHIYGVVIKRALYKADAIAVQTKWMKQAITCGKNFLEAKVVVASPTVDLEGIERNSVSYYDSAVVRVNEFFYPATADTYKNHDCLFKAVSLLRHNGNVSFKVDLTLTEANWSKTFESNNRALNNNICFIGRLQRTQVIKKLQTTILVHPSFIESLGLTLIEARYVGAVIFVADCPYARETLNDYPNAYFFDPFAPAQLATLMEKSITGQLPYYATSMESCPTQAGWDTLIKLLYNLKRSVIT